MMKWISTLPTTNLRIVLSLVMALGTAVRVVWLGWNPGWEWLAFLCMWSGIDVAQFTAKRMTTFQPGDTPVQP